MRIGIDLRWLHQALSINPEDDCTGGIGAYSYSLVNFLLKLDPVNQYVLFGSRAYPMDLLSRYFKTSDRLEIVLLPRSPQITIAPATLGRAVNYIYQQTVVGPEVRRQNLDIMHFQEQGSVILSGSFKKVVSVMDMASSVYIDRFFKSRLAKITWRWHIRKLQNADKIIAISESTKHDVIVWAGIPSQNITVVPLGVPEQLASIPENAEEDKEVRTKLGILGEYFLYVGGLQFNKNIPGLIEAFASLAGHRESIALIMAGETRFWPEEQQALNKQIKAKGLYCSVKMIGWVSGRQLAALYRGAVALVHPSFYEGFGLTTLEAMFYGCPVITSNTSSLPEVVGEAGVLENPRQPLDFAKAMDQILINPEQRAKRQAAGIKRAQKFSWAETARQTLNIYNQLNRKEKDIA